MAKTPHTERKNMFDKSQINSVVTKFNSFFRTKIDLITKRESYNYELLDSFLNNFSLEKIPLLPLEDYCFAKGQKNTMCYWLDNTLKDLGDIHINGQCGFQKFGIQNIDGKYVFMRSNQKCCKYGNNKDEVYQTINKELQKVIKAAIDYDIEAINNSMLPGVLKAKLTYLYNKEQWMPIYVTPDVERLLILFDIPYNKSQSLTEKRVLLYQFYLEIKKQLPFITTWEFMNFVYSIDGYRSVLREGQCISNHSSNPDIRTSQPNKNVRKTIDDENDELSLGDLELTDFVGTYTKKQIKDVAVTASIKKAGKSKRIDYLKKQKSNERKGTIGEKLIVNDEMSKLANIGIEAEVVHKALTDSTCGYDVLSYDQNGKQIFIEVKTTTSNRIDGFYLSANEMEKAIELGKAFRLYRVYNLNVKTKTYNVEIFDGEQLFETFKLKETNFIAEMQ